MRADVLTIGSLFSGIGGLEIGLEWAGLGPIVWQVESDAFCRDVLASHWPDVDRSVVDVRRAGRANLAPVDLVCGGFPCQDVSSAGAGAGLTGSRSGLWFEYERIVRELEPRFVVVENVASGAKRWVDTVVSGLECLGYAAIPFPVSAADVGAWHIRRRVFIVAHLAEQPMGRPGLPWFTRGVGDAADTNTHRQQQPKGVVCEERGRSGYGAETDAADTKRGPIRQQPRRIGGARQSTGSSEPRHDGEERDAADAIGEIPNFTIRDEAKHPEHRRADWWNAEPDVVRVVHGISYGVDRRKALGNSVVPQCAEVIGWIVRELIGDSQ